MEDKRSSDSAAGEAYDVFLSFIGRDTGESFVSFMYNMMKDAGIKVYRDDAWPGQNIGTILQVIDNSKICMPVFSKNFASSHWCLGEVRRMVDLKREIIPIFYHVTSDDVKLKTSLYKDQLKMLEKYHSENQILLWEASLREIGKFKGRNVQDQSAYEFVNELVEDLLIKLKIRHKNVSKNLVGIDFQLESAMNLLSIESGGVRMITIYGMEGIGKTTLAKYIFNKIMDRFDCYCFLDDIAGELSRNKKIDHLLEQLLVNLNPKLRDLIFSSDVHSIMQKTFQKKKALIVLDNVEQKQQIENLVGNGSWFGWGSRIIVTTKDVRTLVIEDEAPESSSRSQYRKVCALEMQLLNSEQSLQLFCWHAFKKDYPELEYKDLTSKIVRTIGGLPLSLEVIGLLLSGKDKNFWEDKANQLKQIVSSGVKEGLRTSFDNLEIFEQQIFLDIACFFINYKVSSPKYMWEACNLHPTIGLNVLISMSLIKIKNGRFWMHDQLRILGREIARGGSFKGPICYRVFDQKDGRYMKMLKDKKGNRRIVGLQLNKFGDTLTAYCFSDLFSLRYLSVNCASLNSDFQHPLPNLKWLVLDFCPANFDMDWLSSSDLVILQLPHSFVDGKWQGWDQIKTRYLKVLDLSYCRRLEVTPNFTNMVDLCYLNFYKCEILRELAEDLSSLENLISLNLAGCTRLTRLPESLGKLKSLATLELKGTRLTKLPDSVGELKELERLLLSYSSIVELPATFGDLESLIFLDLSYSHIEKLPNSIGRLKQLRQLLLNSCIKIERLPESLGDLESLVLLNLSSSSVMELPASIGKLKNLETLEMEESKMDKLPSEIGELSSLKILNLYEAHNIRALPSSVSQLSLLKVLILVSTRISELPDLPQTLTKLHIISFELVTVPNLSRLRNLTDLKLVDGSQWLVQTRMTQSHHLKGIGNLVRLESLELIISNITTLPQDLGVLSQLRTLTLGCPSIKCIPQLPTSLTFLHLRSEHSELKTFNVFYLRGLVTLYVNGFSFTALCKLQLPESLKFLSFTECQFQSTSDSIPPLPNLVHLELLRCKELYEISGVGGLESLETLDIECCESLQRVDVEIERVKVAIFACPMLDLESNKFARTHTSKLFGIEMVDDQKIIRELFKYEDLRKSEYISWWKGSFNEEITAEQVTDPPQPGIGRMPINRDMLTVAKSNQFPPSRQPDTSNLQGVVRQLTGFHTGPVYIKKLAMPASPGGSSAESEGGRVALAGDRIEHHDVEIIDLLENATGPSDPSTPAINPPVISSNEDLYLTSAPYNEVEQDFSWFRKPESVLNQDSDLSSFGLIGVERKVKELESLLQVEVSDIRIVGIYGVGGIGKTILAKLVFDRISTHFAGCSFLQDTREITRQHGGLEILQTKLMSEILMRECTDIGASDDNICFIKEVFCDMRVLIVLDNVDSGFCLSRFVGEVGSFCPGSRIIVTARSKTDLPECSETYEVLKMNDQEAFQLFTCHASKGSSSSRVDLWISNHVFNQKILCAVGRIPLSIEIIGSLLSGVPIDEWESTVDKFKDFPDEELQKRLKVRYDALSDQERQIFLDIACFINGEDSRISSYMWHDFDGGLKRLLSLSLVKIGDDKELLMHDELRELGRELARQEEFSETEQMNKFFLQVRDFDALLAEKDLEKVEALNLCIDKRSQYRDTDFRKMPRLRFLKMGDANMCGDFSDVFTNLRWLHWEGCPGTLKATNFCPNNLVILNLSRSKVTSTWEGWSQIKLSNNLKVLNLASCKNLIKTPDLSNLPNLEILILEKCSSLVRIDDSVKCLERLQCLNLKFCTELNALPKELGSLKALTEILMDGTSIRDIPISVGHLVSLQTLNASSCVSLTHLPSSISYLVSLSELTLDGVQIHELPCSIGELKNLRNLSLKDCKWMQKLPESIGKLKDSLIQLDVSGSGISEFPSSIQDLQRLKVLKMNSCFIRIFPKSICYLSKLEELHASHCRSLESDVPHEIGNLHSLKILRLGYSRISSLPSSIVGLYLLQNLDLDHCNMLHTLPVLPSSLSRLCFNSSGMVNFLQLHSMPNLEELIFAGSDSEEPIHKEIDFGHFFISQYPKLKAMELRHSGISGIHTIRSGENCTVLRKITLSCANLKFMSHAAPLPLLNLSFHHCHSLKMIKAKFLECLVELQIVDSAVIHIADLGLLQALRILNISKCQIVSLHGLDKLSSLVSLSITHCQCLRKLPNLSKLVILKELKLHCCGKLSEIHGLDDLISLRKCEVTECAAANLPKLLAAVKCSPSGDKPNQPLPTFLSVKNYLSYFGISHPCLGRILDMYPKLLTSDSHSDLYPVIDFLLNEVSIPFPDINKSISRYSASIPSNHNPIYAPPW